MVMRANKTEGSKRSLGTLTNEASASKHHKDMIMKAKVT